jgi:transposase InsO family protein
VGGELVHVDVKKLGRILKPGHRVTGSRRGQAKTHRDGKQVSLAGWEFVHVAIDDHSRLAYAEVLPSERATDAVAFLGRAVSWYREQGVEPEAVLTDNGVAYRSRRWREHCAELGLRHLRTRPYTPRTNGKAERFIQTVLRQWAYRYVYPTSAHRARALSGWLRWYNRRRPHGSLGGRSPISRVSHLCGHYN